MAYDNWLHPQVREQLQELIQKNLARHTALSEPEEFTKSKRFDNDGHVIVLIHVVGNIHETKKAWLMTFIVRNLIVKPMGSQGSNIPVGESLRLVKSLVPEVALTDWAAWKKNRKVLWSGSFVNHTGQATA